MVKWFFIYTINVNKIFYKMEATQFDHFKPEYTDAEEQNKITTISSMLWNYSELSKRCFVNEFEEEDYNSIREDIEKFIRECPELVRKARKKNADFLIANNGFVSCFV